jgi:hypothetical protein
LEIVLKPVESEGAIYTDFIAVEQVEKSARVSRRGKAVAGEIVSLLQKLDAYEAPELPVEVYLDNRAGQYTRMLEAIVDVASELGMFDLARVTLVDLLRMTKVGRAKADLTVGGKLRDEHPLTHLSDEELKNLVSKPADA